MAAVKVRYLVLYNNKTILALGINTQASYHKLISFRIQSADRLIWINTLL